MAAKPIVDGIEKDHAGELIVLRVDVQEAAGEALAQEYAVLGTPTFILFDAQGQELWRSAGSISAGQVADSLK